jgi:hypothetical protein
MHASLKYDRNEHLIKIQDRNTFSFHNGLEYRDYRVRICKTFKEPRNRFQDIDSASLCTRIAWRAGTITLFGVPAR